MRVDWQTWTSAQNIPHCWISVKASPIFFFCFFYRVLKGPCSPNPCKNDAVCEVTAQSRRGDVFSEYVCKCQPGFEGVHCQNSKSEPVLLVTMVTRVRTWCRKKSYFSSTFSKSMKRVFDSYPKWTLLTSGWLSADRFNLCGKNKHKQRVSWWKRMQLFCLITVKLLESELSRSIFDFAVPSLGDIFNYYFL